MGIRAWRLLVQEPMPREWSLRMRALSGTSGKEESYLLRKLGAGWDTPLSTIQSERSRPLTHGKMSTCHSIHSTADEPRSLPLPYSRTADSLGPDNDRKSSS